MVISDIAVEFDNRMEVDIFGLLDCAVAIKITAAAI
jgi:hypothetical protein